MEQENPQTVNGLCPMCGGDTDAECWGGWEGQNVGFCCGECQEEWRRLPEATKREKLDEIIASSSGGGGVS